MDDTPRTSRRSTSICTPQTSSPSFLKTSEALFFFANTSKSPVSLFLENKCSAHILLIGFWRRLQISDISLALYLLFTASWTPSCTSIDPDLCIKPPPGLCMLHWTTLGLCNHQIESSFSSNLFTWCVCYVRYRKFHRH